MLRALDAGADQFAHSRHLSRGARTEECFGIDLRWITGVMSRQCSIEQHYCCAVVCGLLGKFAAIALIGNQLIRLFSSGPAPAPIRRCLSRVVVSNNVCFGDRTSWNGAGCTVMGRCSRRNTGDYL
jgi:hypothetical protein